MGITEKDLVILISPDIKNLCCNFGGTATGTCTEDNSDCAKPTSGS